MKDGSAVYEVTPHVMGIKEINAKIPVRDGWLLIQVIDGKVEIEKVL